MKPRSELNPGVWQGDCFPVLIRIARKCFGDRECRCWYSGGQTLIALRIAQKFRTRRLALHAFPMRRATAVRNRPDKARRRLFRLGRDRVEFERCCLTRRRGGGGETRGEHLFRIGFRACKAMQESQNLRARRQRRSYGFAARLTLGSTQRAADTATRFSSPTVSVRGNHLFQERIW